MTVVTTKLVVEADGTMSLVDPLPAGEYVATIVLNDEAVAAGIPRPLTRADIPVWDAGPWPAGATFSRDEMYDDDGR